MHPPHFSPDEEEIIGGVFFRKQKGMKEKI
jgi:hypothetical protein